MANPAITAVMTAVAERIEGLTPIQHEDVPFLRLAGSLDPDDHPEAVVERRFRVGFQALTDRSSEGGGVVNQGLSDRTARLVVRILYPLLGEEDMDLEMATDAELVQRAMARKGWPGTPIQRAAITTARATGTETLAAVEHRIDVQYRDVE